jgi:biotin transport system substrate-specific component
MKTKILEIKQKYFFSIKPNNANVIGIFLGSLLIAMLAQISIHIPFSPVPITGQTIGVLLVGGILGSRKGLLSVATYISEGALGLPVFAEMSAGLPVLLGPTGGYILSFIPAVLFIGYLTERNFTKNIIPSFISCILATFLILVLGTLFLSLFFGLKDSFMMGFYPFIFVGIMKSFISAITITTYKKLS